MTSPRLAGWSLRARVTAAGLLGVLVLLGVCGLAVVAYFESTLLRQVDDGLVGDSEFVARVLPEVAQLPPGTVVHRDVLVQVVDPEGVVFGGSENAEGLPALASLEPGEDPQAMHFRDTELDGEPLRALIRPSEAFEGLQLVLARPVGQVDTAVAEIRRLVLAGVPLLSIALGVLLWLVTGRALRPVDDMRSTVEEIEASDLGRRVPTSGRDDEIDRLAATVNDMLGRLEASVERQRRLVADASHELRSPIAGVRVQLETEQTGDAEVVRESRAEALEDLRRLQQLIDDLLLLASGDAARHEPERWVDLDELVLSQAEQLRRTTSLHIDVAGVSGGQVYGHAAELERLVGNLASNAARHAESRVSFEVRERTDLVELTIADDGAGVPEADRSRIFERFTRLDDARDRDRGGAGLGLAIVADVVAGHGGEVAVEDAEPNGARFVVRIRKSKPSPPAPTTRR